LHFVFLDKSKGWVSSPVDILRVCVCTSKRERILCEFCTIFSSQFVLLNPNFTKTLKSKLLFFLEAIRRGDGEDVFLFFLFMNFFNFF